MRLRVERLDDMSWRVVDNGDDALASATAWVRPDGRCTLTVAGDTNAAVDLLVPAVAAAIPHELLANVRASNDELRALYAAAGFRDKRTEAVYRLAVADAVEGLRGARLPENLSAVSVNDVGEGELRVLDDRLRHDVPGTDGWHWSTEGFREETFGAWLDPDLYLVAVDGGSLIGIARMWAHEGRRPRLGCTG